MFTEGNIIKMLVSKGLPKGAKFCYYIPMDATYGYVDLVFEHPDFQVIMMGNEIPLFEIVVEKLL